MTGHQTAVAERPGTAPGSAPGTAPEARSVMPVDILASGVLSPAGVGAAALARSVLAGGPAVGSGTGEPAVEPASGAPGSGREVRSVPDFDPAGYLGRKGLRSLSRVSRLGLVCCELTLNEWDRETTEEELGRTGVVFGTSTGSIRATAEFTRETFEADRPYLVNPSLFPGTIYNATAGQAAIRYGFTGANATIAGGVTSGLAVLRYARTLLLAGRADRLLVGAADELSDQMLWGLHRSGALAADAAVGEGGAMFLLGTGGSDPASGTERPEAQLLACEIGFHDPGTGALGATDALAARIREALRRSGADADQVVAVVPGATGYRGWAAVERRAVATALGRPLGGLALRVADVTGVVHSAGGALGLAALLGAWREQPPAPGSVGLLTAVGPDGDLGCAVIRHGAGPS